MADRRSLLSRFWPPSASRRPSTTQTAAPTPSTTASSSSRTSTTSSPPPVAETKTPSPATSPRTEPRKATPKQTTTPSPSPKGESKISSQSRATTRSPSSSKPASPSRFSVQSRSPPQPSPSSNAAPPARSVLPSPTFTPKRASKPPSPSSVTSHSPKQGSSTSSRGKEPASPSKDSTQPTEKVYTSYEAPISATNEDDPKPAASQQEPETKETVKPDDTKVANGETQTGASFKHDEEARPSHLSKLGNAPPPAHGSDTRAMSKSLDSSSVNGGENEPHIGLDEKPEETKDVREVEQATSAEANEETKKEVDDDSVAPESVSEAQVVEKAEIPNEVKRTHGEKQEAPDTKDILATPLKKSKGCGARDKSAVQNGEHIPLHKNIRTDMSNFGNRLTLGDNKKAISDTPVSVITLAGENKGASMHMESDPSKREDPIHIRRAYKSNPDESLEATTDGEEGSEGKRSKNETRSMEDQVREAYVNNNAQAINNSIVFNSSIVEGNPGVHMVVSHLSTNYEKKMPERSFVGNERF